MDGKVPLDQRLAIRSVVNLTCQPGNGSTKLREPRVEGKASFENVFAPKSHPRKIKNALSTIKTKTGKEDVVGLRSLRLGVRVPPGIQGKFCFYNRKR